MTLGRDPQETGLECVKRALKRAEESKTPWQIWGGHQMSNRESDIEEPPGLSDGMDGNECSHE